ncbi:MAG: TldD/PmbA family protein [Dehalococcoidia bacterium]|nr:TldD/PmbA family protein [Dehalococcoidia bacterium]
MADQLVPRDEIEAALQGHAADYAEIRMDDTATNRLVYRGRELEEIGRTLSFGGNARALVNGGWGFVSFNDPAGLRERVAEAVSQARSASGGGGERSRLAEVAPVTDIVPLYVRRDPRAIPLARKKELLDGYNDLMLSTAGVTSTNIVYSDAHKRVVFASSEGSYIEQERIDVVSRLAATARKNGDMQQSSMSLGALGDFTYIEEMEETARGLGRRAVELLSASYVKAGTYPVVLDPVLAGVFCHEAFGHLSESDHVYENERMKEIMVLGRRFGQPHLNIADGAAVPGLRGSYRYDDEGVPARKTDLIRDGILVGRLHSRETAGKMGEPLSGNARALDYRFPPIVRMTNTYIEPGTLDFEELIADIKEGVYARNWFGGTTSMEMFTFSAGEAYMIRDGKIAELLRPPKLTGNLFSTLLNIDALGNDMEVPSGDGEPRGWNQGGGCGKMGQMPLPVSNGSPHIRIQDCVVGER